MFIWTLMMLAGGWHLHKHWDTIKEFFGNSDDTEENDQE